MRTAGIICEYNPFHRGHLLQLRKTREMVGEDGAIVCLMSGYFVQRGEPALFSPEVRTRVALLHGADLVLAAAHHRGSECGGVFCRDGGFLSASNGLHRPSLLRQ